MQSQLREFPLYLVVLVLLCSDAQKLAFINLIAAFAASNLDVYLARLQNNWQNSCQNSFLFSLPNLTELDTADF